VREIDEREADGHLDDRARAVDAQVCARVRALRGERIAHDAGLVGPLPRERAVEARHEEQPHAAGARRVAAVHVRLSADLVRGGVDREGGVRDREAVGEQVPDVDEHGLVGAAGERVPHGADVRCGGELDADVRVRERDGVVAGLGDLGVVGESGAVRARAGLSSAYA